MGGESGRRSLHLPHEEVQLNWLHDFMQQHGAELAATLAPELMGYNEQIPAVKQSAMQHSVDYLREALPVWLAAGEKLIILRRTAIF